MKTKVLFLLIFLLGISFSCRQWQKPNVLPENHKIVVYQMYTRLFGNTNTTNKPWGTIEENGVGKFNDITDKALQKLKALGVTHVWFTGVPHHATVTDYTAYGITNDDPDVVKGRAGSPYAVKDYYNVDPDLAVNPARRLDEFRELVHRTHENGLKVIIDIVPNHVARGYHSISQPEGTEDFGAGDDTSEVYRRDNNFYYIPGLPFKVPDPQNNYQPLGGEKHAGSDGIFDENPAKWTGNGTREPKPSFWDWYETVKLNFGIKPDGTKDFESLPPEFAGLPFSDHYAFWQSKEVPSTWKKFRDIALFWMAQGVDGFRFDMAEMVPVEFWSYLNSAIKNRKPDAFLLAEIYNPAIYRDYINLGKMDFLYDKVDLYDTLKHIIRGNGSTDNLPPLLAREADIESRMLHFLENHDEERIASPEFAGDPNKALPAMVLSATIGSSPVMIYFGQEVGEPGAENGGFGSPSRTSKFDYIGVPHHQRWMNNGKFDGGQLSKEEAELRDFYQRLLNFTVHSTALAGHFREIHLANRHTTEGYSNRVFSFVRWKDREKLVVTCNFDAVNSYSFNLVIPEEVIKEWDLKGGIYKLSDQLYSSENKLFISEGLGKVRIELKPLESQILQVIE
jgi:glycosidase